MKGTYDLGIVYCKQDKLDCSCFSDSDWAGESNDRKSVSGYCFKISGGVVSCRSNKQNCVTLSTAEAEYVALSSASQETIWLMQLLDDLKIKYPLPLIIHKANQAALSTRNNPTHHPKTKHISIKYHFIREQNNLNMITLEYCPAHDMLAALLTKGSPKDKFARLRDLLGILPYSKFLET